MHVNSVSGFWKASLWPQNSPTNNLIASKFQMATALKSGKYRARNTGMAGTSYGCTSFRRKIIDVTLIPTVVCVIMLF